MAQFVVEFGAVKPGDICSAILEQIPQRLRTVSVLAAGVDDLMYRDVGASAKQVTSDILSGAVVSAAFHPAQGGLRYALILPPHFNGQQLSLWSATLEWTSEEWRFSWKSLLMRTELTFVTVGNEEGPEVSDADVNNANSKVWRSWPTIITAVRSPNQEWRIILNPSSKLSAGLGINS